MTTRKQYTVWGLWVCTVLFSAPLFAASQKTIEQQFDAQGLSSLELDVSVAEMDVEVYDGHEVRVEITLKADRRLFGLRAGSVDGIELRMDTSDTTLYLGIDEQDLDQEWIVQVPRHLAMSIMLGVGELNIDKLENDLVAEIGVGSVRVEVIESAIAEIQLSTGVGDAAIRGMSSRADNERSFISADAHYQGEGEHNVTIDVGVGEILVRSD